MPRKRETRTPAKGERLPRALPLTSTMIRAAQYWASWSAPRRRAERPADIDPAHRR